MVNKKLLLSILLTFLLFSCFTDNVSKKRSKIAKRKKIVKIGVAWPFELQKDLILEGLELAKEEINSNGGILKKKVELVPMDDKADVTEGLIIAEKLSENPEIMALIGHCNSYVSIETALTYETNKLLMFSPGSTNPELTKKGYSYIFRNVPTDDMIGQNASIVCKDRGYKNIVIAYADDTYGLGLANSFENIVLELGLKIVNRASFSDGSAKEFEYITDKWKVYDFDAIFFAGSIAPAIPFINTVRDKNYSQPIFGGDGLDSLELLKLDSDKNQNIFIVTLYNPESNRKEAVLFQKNFREKYGHDPDSWAAQGYDALNIITFAMKNAGSVDPIKVAAEIKKIKNWNGVTGVHTFNENGDVTNKPLVLKYIVNGTFKYMDLN